MSENALSTTAVRRFADCEATIASGLKTFGAVGKALLEINDQRYYRVDFPTFDAYLKARWGISKSRGYQLMQAAELSTDVDVENEAQARELAGLETEEAVEVVEETKRRNNGKVTAPALRQTRERKNAQGKGSESPHPVATGDSVPAAGGERSYSRVDHGAGMTEPAAPAATPIDTTSRELDDIPCPFCKGTGRAFKSSSVPAKQDA